MKILVIQGPNLNLLGQREPEVYGRLSLSDVCQLIDTEAARLGAVCTHFQSNHEGALIDRVQEALTDGTQAIVINPGAYTHTSIALRDALLGVALPFIEVHLSNVHQREAFRHHSYFSDVAKAVIAGLGAEGYLAAIRYFTRH